MIFSSFEFLVFFAAVLALRAGLRDLDREKRFLLLASWLFYMSWGPRFVLLIVFTSLVDWWIGRRLGEIDDPRSRRRLLVTSLLLNLGVLAFFKYTNFVVENGWLALRALGWEPDPVTLDILLPVGISFFTFQSMSYTIDVYRRQIPPCRSAVDLCLFVALFPQLVAGPIVRAADLLPQFRHRVRATPEDFERGLLLFGIGAFKKLVISDQISPYVDLAFGRPAAFGAAFLLQGLLGYAIQIYCDFSGYSDMAIGMGHLLGMRIPANFRAPYTASSVTEFWQRWHITLSQWFREYLFLPLSRALLRHGGSHHPDLTRAASLVITMTLIGLWHGPTLGFLAWGAYHGALLAANAQLFGGRGRPARPFGRVATTIAVLAGWVLFRSPSLGAAGGVYRALLGGNGWGPPPMSLPGVTSAFVMLLLTLAVLTNLPHDTVDLGPRPDRIYATALAAALVLALMRMGEPTGFIYFQF